MDSFIVTNLYELNKSSRQFRLTGKPETRHPDPLSLGVETTEEGMVISYEGVPVENLFVVGTPRKAQDWESTAVPELRIQAADVAARLVELKNERPF